MGFLNEFSEESQLMIGNVVGIIAAIIFIYITNQSYYYSDLYTKVDKNIFTFIGNIGILKFFMVVLLLVLASIAAGWAVYVNLKKVLSGDKKFIRITAALGSLLILAAIGCGFYNARYLLMLFVSIIFTGFMCLAMLLSLFRTSKD